MDQLSFFLAATVRMAIPLLIAALGLVVSERAGLMNIGVEGTMLSGAFAAFAVAIYTNSYWLGLIAGMLAGAALGATMAPASRQIKRAAHKAAKRVNEAVDHLADAMDM